MPEYVFTPKNGGGSPTTFTEAYCPFCGKALTFVHRYGEEHPTEAICTGRDCGKRYIVETKPSEDDE